MGFVNFKNNEEKLGAIKAFCNSEIKNIEYNINCYKRDQECSLDYRDEIHDLEIAKKRFLTILEIIDAEPTKSIYI